MSLFYVVPIEQIFIVQQTRSALMKSLDPSPERTDKLIEGIRTQGIRSYAILGEMVTHQHCNSRDLIRSYTRVSQAVWKTELGNQACH